MTRCFVYDRIVPIVLSALLIFGLRICDVSMGTIRTMFTVQGRKYLAAGIGFFEVMIWAMAIRQVFSQLDNLWNVLGYGGGFAVGTWLGITIEQKLAIGIVQVHVVSRHHTDVIADALRKNRFGVTIIAGEGGTGGMPIISSLIPRKRADEFKSIVDGIDPRAMIVMHSANLYRGFVHGSRK
ncbi:MAG: DUF5698 domain-containing protein [Bacteroidota bacterium]|nr:DUF5698 domain-containing protein [Bacteroidota bacterium]